MRLVPVDQFTMATDALIIDHPRRRELNDEVHARPPGSLATPCELSYLVRVTPPTADHDQRTALLADLVERLGGPAPDAGNNHYTAEFDELRLRWERHTEFARYSFITERLGEAPFDAPPIRRVPSDWLANMQGEFLVAVHASVIAGSDEAPDFDAISSRYFDGNLLIGSRIADGAAIALTDLRIREDGFTRLLLLNRSMSPTQCGRNVQRLLEIETYRMMMLLALPVARELSPVLDHSERELTSISEVLVKSESQQEQAMLKRLTTLAAENQTRHLRSDYRFAAANAYYEIVQQRIQELREGRIPGLQTFEEFNSRRLKPAFKTFQAVAARQQSLVLRMARATQLLSTRVDITRQQQNQALLASMNRRAEFQLRLQATVEGLSVAAVTYYVVSLIGILVESLIESGLPLNRALIMMASVPVVALTAYAGMRRIRAGITRRSQE